jgi:hypothetical protein
MPGAVGPRLTLPDGATLGVEWIGPEQARDMLARSTHNRRTAGTTRLRSLSAHLATGVRDLAAEAPIYLHETLGVLNGTTRLMDVAALPSDAAPMPFLVVRGASEVIRAQFDNPVSARSLADDLTFAVDHGKLRNARDVAAVVRALFRDTVESGPVWQAEVKQTAQREAAIAWFLANGPERIAETVGQAKALALRVGLPTKVLSWAAFYLGDNEEWNDWLACWPERDVESADPTVQWLRDKTSTTPRGKGGLQYDLLARLLMQAFLAHRAGSAEPKRMKPLHPRVIAAGLARGAAA